MKGKNVSIDGDIAASFEPLAVISIFLEMMKKMKRIQNLHHIIYLYNWIASTLLPAHLIQV